MNDIDSSTVDFSTCSFAVAIREAAAGIGREPTADQIATFEREMRAAAFVDADNRVMLQSDGGAVTVDQYVSRRAGHMPRAAVASASDTPMPAAKAWLPSDGFAGMGRTWAERRQAQVAAEAANWPNPWMTGPTYNRTRQQVIQNVNSALAADLRLKAGVA